MRLGYLSGIVIFVLASLARAQAPTSTGPSTPAHPSDQGPVEQARALAREGLRLHRDRDFEGAHAKYLAAWNLNRSFLYAANLGTVELALHRYREAAEHYAIVVREMPKEKDPDEQARIRANYEKVRGFIGALSITADVDGAEIVVNGKIVGRAPLADPVFVDPGRVTVQARLGERASETRAFDVTAASSMDIRLVLQGLPTVAAAPSADAPGSPTPAVRMLAPAPGSKANDSNESVPDAGPKLAPVLIGSGLTVAGLAMGFVFAAKANSKEDDTRQLGAGLPAGSPCSSGSPYPNACGRLLQVDQDRQGDRNLSTLGFVGAGVAGLATAAYLLWPRKSTTSGAVLVPSASYGRGELFLSGAF